MALGAGPRGRGVARTALGLQPEPGWFSKLDDLGLLSWVQVLRCGALDAGAKSVLPRKKLPILNFLPYCVTEPRWSFW